MLQDIQFTLNFEKQTLDPDVFERLDSNDKDILNNPMFQSVIQDVKYEISESIFFHSNDLN